MIRLSIIAALSRNFAIGLDNRLLWHIPEDLKNFKAITMAKPLIMGRKTFESIGRPLPGRVNIVISRDTQWRADGVQVERSLEAALSAAYSACEQRQQDEVMVIGGEQVYRQALPYATRLYLTEIDAEICADTFFPDFVRTEWRELERTPGSQSADYAYQFVILERSAL
ncbi:MAG: dihydrofolate reductase [Porticoccaceae bacterium]|nr:dihydrofolate reductase [Porticoccaceae bacterium]